MRQGAREIEDMRGEMRQKKTQGKERKSEKTRLDYRSWEERQKEGGERRREKMRGKKRIEVMGRRRWEKGER